MKGILELINLKIAAYKSNKNQKSNIFIDKTSLKFSYLCNY